jgi:hypothetical protein
MAEFDAVKVWSVLRYLMSLDDQNYEEQPELGFLWDDAWDAGLLIGPSHRTLLPHLIEALKDLSVITKERNDLRLYALDALPRLNGDLREAVPVVQAILRDETRFRGLPRGPEVCRAAAYVLKRITHPSSAPRPWWRFW